MIRVPNLRVVWNNGKKGDEEREFKMEFGPSFLDSVMPPAHFDCRSQLIPKGENLNNFKTGELVFVKGVGGPYLITSMKMGPWTISFRKYTDWSKVDYHRIGADKSIGYALEASAADGTVSVVLNKGEEQMECPVRRALTPREQIQAKIARMEDSRAVINNRLKELRAIENGIKWTTAPESVQKKAVEAADRI